MIGDTHRRLRPLGPKTLLDSQCIEAHQAAPSNGLRERVFRIRPAGRRAAAPPGCFYAWARNLRPYYKFTVPLVQPAAEEEAAWRRYREDEVDAATLARMLSEVRLRARP